MKSMEKQRKWPIFRTIAAVVQLVAEIVTTIVVFQLNILPVKFTALFVAVMVFLAAGNGLLMFLPVKGVVAKWRKITACVLAILIILGCLFVSKLTSDAYDVLDGVAGGNSAGTRNTYVLVLNENTARELADTKSYRFGVVENFDIEHTQQMIALVEKQTGEKINLTNYSQVTVLADALYSGEVDAVIMSGVSVSLLIEREAYADFLSRVRILHTLTYEDPDGPAPTKDENFVVEEPFVVYISGSDTRSNKLVVSRSDVNILAVVNPKTKQVLLLNTPRDYYVPNPASKDGVLDKLTHCGNYGIDCSMKALENLYTTQIDYYGQINFSGFEKLIDAIGGITVFSDQSFTANGETFISYGENNLDGKSALNFARDRYHVNGGDNGRGKNQMKVIKAVIEKMTTSSTLISNYADILGSLEGMFATSFRTEEISNLVKMQLSDMATWNVQSFAVIGRGDMQETYSAPGENLYVMWPNETYVAHASYLVQKVMRGDTLTEEDVQIPKA